jgi:hypothetical protein
MLRSRISIPLFEAFDQYLLRYLSVEEFAASDMDKLLTLLERRTSFHISFAQTVIPLMEERWNRGEDLSKSIDATMVFSSALEDVVLKLYLADRDKLQTMQTLSHALMNLGASLVLYSAHTDYSALTNSQSLGPLMEVIMSKRNFISSILFKDRMLQEHFVTWSSRSPFAFVDTDFQELVFYVCALLFTLTSEKRNLRMVIR